MFFLTICLLPHLLLFHQICWFTLCAAGFNEELAKWANDVSTKNVESILAEFVAPVKPPLHLMKASEAEDKSRLAHNYEPLLDATRVKLTSGRRYIHASWVRDGRGPKGIIAGQCPVLGNKNSEVLRIFDTMYDFWSMVLQESVDAIIFLLRALNDSGCPKHYPVRPDELGYSYWNPLHMSKIHLRSKGERYLDEHLFRTEILVKKPLNRELVVDHIRSPGWADNGIPAEHEHYDINELLTVLEHKKRVVVHCVDGIGRTGTILALHLAMDKLRTGQPLSVPKVIEELRSQRAGSVPRKEQYLYINSALLRFALSKAKDIINTNAVEKKIKEIVTEINSLIAEERKSIEEKNARAKKGRTFRL